jgi:proteasome lid subunit RPN8/RPN11
LRLTETTYAQMVGLAYDQLPEEACGLLVGRARTASIERFEPCRNTAESSRIYAIDGLDYMRIEKAADADGLDLIGVMHSHTHTDAYPSPTDVERAFDPDWHYVIVSLRDSAPVLRSYEIRDGRIAEERVVVERR